MLWDNRSLLVVTHEEEAKKHTAVDCDTDRVPANMAENGDVAVTATAVRMINYSRHTRGGGKKTHRGRL